MHGGGIKYAKHVFLRTWRELDLNLQGAAKSRPQKFFFVFSATVWNFNLKFYGFIN